MNDGQSFWLYPLVDLEKNINSSKEGLTTKEAKLRLKKVGPNRISHHQKRNLLFQFLSRFRSPLVILLVLASVFSFFVGQIQDASIILIIVMFSVLIDFFQE
ncbi:MAG: magnesium-translocating P-type ATPase, partial [Alphaproteobacteria bacterium]|nr:magnesium-translocating P-type ATPase [Alphaproteobacteria bacterium]